MENRIDYKEARRIALATMAEWLPGYSQGKRKGDELEIVSPLRNDRNPGSFSINLREGLFNDYASDDHGDILTLYARLRGVSDRDAASELSTKNINYDFDSFIKNSSKGQPPAIPGWSTYYDYSDGLSCNFRIYRYEKGVLEPEKKTFKQWHHDGSSWVPRKAPAPPAGYPLFNLAGIKTDTKTDIVITEGEKAALAVPAPFIAVAWSGGSSAYKTADFSPLRGRRVILWPDNDRAGKDAMDNLEPILKNLGCKIARVKPSPEWREKADAADLTPEAASEVLSGVVRNFPQERDLFPLVRFGDMKVTAPRWIVKDFFEENCLAQFFGESGVGKSFVVIDLALSIATGKDFHGNEVKKSGPVIYIAGEGHSGIGRRITAWVRHHETPAHEAPIFISEKACGLGDPELMSHVKTSVDRVAEQFGPPVLIVIDTWSRSLVGNENSSEDTARAIRSLDSLRAEYQCSALIVHHSGLNEKERARGSSVLRAALDAEYIVGREGESIVVKNTKMKDGTPPHPIGFDFNSVDLGFNDEDGNAVVSAALSRAELHEGKTKKSALGKNERLVMDILQNHDNVLDADDLQEKTGLDRKRFPEVLKTLKSKGKIEIMPGNIIKVPLYAYMQ